MSTQGIQLSPADSFSTAAIYIQPQQELREPITATLAQFPVPGTDYIDAFATCQLPVPLTRDQPAGDFSSGTLPQESPSLHDDQPPTDDFPIRVPHFPECPHQETLASEAQVEEWIAVRAMEFAFTKHGERKARKASGEVSLQQGKPRRNIIRSA